MEMSDNTPGFGSSSDEDYSTTKRKKLRKRKSRRDLGARMAAKDKRSEDNSNQPSSVTPLPKLKQAGRGKTIPSRDDLNPNKKLKDITKSRTFPQVDKQNEVQTSKDKFDRRKSSVTNYDLQAFLKNKKLVDKNVNMRTVKSVIKTVNKMKARDEGMSGIEEVEGTLTSASETDKRRKKSPARPNIQLGQKFRDTVKQIVAKSKGVELPKSMSDKYKTVMISNDEFEAQIKSMKHIPPPPAGPKTAVTVPSTRKMESGQVLGLPPVLVQAGDYKNKIPHQFIAEFDKFADVEFYSDFKFAYIILPIPCDELPRE